MPAEAATYRGVLGRVFDHEILFSVLVELTYRCNLDCVFCYNDLGLRGEPLTRAEYLGFFQDLVDLQVMNLTLSGGEPLAHPDFFALGRATRELGFVVRVKSNGHALGPELARRLRDEVDPYMLELSLHGARPETHDRQTRVAGSFERLVRNLRGMLELGLRLKLNATLTRWNEGEVEAMFALADDLGLRLQFDPEVTPRDDGDQGPLALTASRAGVRDLFRLEFARAEAQARKAGLDVPELAAPRADDIGPTPQGKHCGAGATGVAVDPYGNVYPCVSWRKPVGNLHERSIKEIWSGSAGLDEVRALTVAAKQVVHAEGTKGSLMNFCPGLAASTSGDPLRVYAGAKARAETLTQVMAERKRVPLRVLSGT